MGKFLRFVGILLMGLTSALIILSGVGTTCVALDAAQYDGMEAITQYQWLYIFYVLAFVAFGILGARATIFLVRGKKNAYHDSLIILVAAIIVGGVHMATSRALRGSSMPLDFIVYAAIFTFFVFLLFGFPTIKALVGFERGGNRGKTAAGGMSAIIAGFLFLSVHMWAGPTHIFDGVNYADAFHLPMMIVGGALFLIGLGLLVFASLSSGEVCKKAASEAQITA